MLASRRAFLRAAACVPVAGAGQWLIGVSDVTASHGEQVLLVESSCLLRESFEGYEACVAAAGHKCAAGSASCGVDASLVLAPAAALTSVSEARWLWRRAEAGASVLVESGGMFLSPAEFCRHQSVVRSAFGLTVLPPVELWQQQDRGIPYVDFTWPVPARVRDFSRLVRLDPYTAGRHGNDSAMEIARVGGAAAGAKIRTGEGILTFLGSPLGPHLLSGDREAWSWFRALVEIALPPVRHGGIAPKGVFGPPRGRTLTDDSV